MVQLVEVQQLRGAVGGDMFCCLLTEEPPSKKESKFSFLCNSRGYAFRGENQFLEVFFSQRIRGRRGIRLVQSVAYAGNLITSH